MVKEILRRIPLPADEDYFDYDGDEDDAPDNDDWDRFNESFNW